MSAEPIRVTPFTDEEATAILRGHGLAPTGNASWIGAGAWSDCFLFTRRGQAPKVIRIGKHGEDFAKDRTTSDLRTPAVPIPVCTTVGELPDGYFFAISDYVPGTPLERVTPWSSVAPAFVGLLEGLRAIDTSSFQGWGRWDANKRAPFDSWSGFLLDVIVDGPGRIQGWRAALDTQPALAHAFDAYIDPLRALTRDDIPHSLAHVDLLNRNVHVQDGVVTGVFDWGNSIAGDHLYDLAVLHFWEPWLEGIDADRVISGLRSSWANTGYSCPGFEQRMHACLLHTGLEHIAYHAFCHNWAQAQAVLDRIDAVLQRSWQP